MSLYGNFSTTDNGNAGGDDESTGGGSRRGGRKVYYSGAETDGHGNYWDVDEEDWLPIPGADPSKGSYVGETREIDGKNYIWTGTEWILNTTPEVTPIGDTPWLLLLLLCGAYAAFLSRRKRGDVLGLPA